MKKLLFALLLLCLFCTCKKDNYSNLCGGRNPIQNLPWLKSRIDTIQKYRSNSTITRGEYQGQTLCIFSTNCGAGIPCFKSPIYSFYDCDDNTVHLSEAQSDDIIYNNQLLYKQIIWPQ